MAERPLWAPWRLPYIVDEDRPANPGCFLCRYVDSPDDDATNYVVARTPLSVIVLNRYPYNNGHVLVAPREHKGKLGALAHDELVDLSEQLRDTVALLEATLGPDGFNVGLNLGEVAGAGLPGHLHWHIVPRWSGDTNFMCVSAATRVIPQALDDLYAQLTAEGR